MPTKDERLQALANDVSALAADLINLALVPLMPFEVKNSTALQNRADAFADEASRLQRLVANTLSAEALVVAKRAVAAAQKDIDEINGQSQNTLTISGVNAKLVLAKKECKQLK
jgi:hypothetical protein